MTKKFKTEKIEEEKIEEEEIMVLGFDYYEVKFKLTREFLGTCSEASIWDDHILQKAKKMIQQSNAMGKKVTKAFDKYKGDEILEEKNIAEIQGIITTFSGLVGKPIDKMPDNMVDLLLLSETIEEEFQEAVKRGEQQKTSVFMRKPLKNGKSHAIISTHMILGNFKANTKVRTNNGDKSILPTKVSVGEVFSLDVKPVEEFMTPDNDIMMKKDVKKDTQEKRDLCIRPIRFNYKGKETTAISISERLPIGTEFGCTLRVRKKSPITEQKLRTLLDMGKNQGFGANRGSGNYGAYNYKLKKLKKFVEPTFKGWS